MREETTNPGTFLLERDGQNHIKVRIRGEREVIQPKKEENKNIVKIVFNSKDSNKVTPVEIGENNKDKRELEKITLIQEKDICADKTLTKDCQSQNEESVQEKSIEDTTRCEMTEIEIEAAYEDLCASYRDEIYPTEKEKEANSESKQDQDEHPMPWFTTAVDCTQGELYSILEESSYSLVEEDLEQESETEDNEVKEADENLEMGEGVLRVESMEEVGPIFSNIFTKRTPQKEADGRLVFPMDIPRLPTEPEDYEAPALFTKPLNEDSVQRWTRQIRSRTIPVNCHNHQGIIFKYSPVKIGQSL